jgi:hypothetical protein
VTVVGDRTFEEVIKPGMMVHVYNPNAWEAEAGGPYVQGQPPGLCRKTLSQKKKSLSKEVIR